MSLDKYMDCELSLEAYLWSWQCDLRKNPSLNLCVMSVILL